MCSVCFRQVLSHSSMRCTPNHCIAMVWRDDELATWSTLHAFSESLLWPCGYVAVHWAWDWHWGLPVHSQLGLQTMLGCDMGLQLGAFSAAAANMWSSCAPSIQHLLECPFRGLNVFKLLVPCSCAFLVPSCGLLPELQMIR